MSKPSQFVLYDIPSRDPRHCWSWNAWKTRLLLNFKGLDYVTEWTEYPDIKPKFEKHFPGETEFTVPTIRLPGGETYVMDSRKIADRIEAEYPSPSLHLDSPYFDRVVVNLRAAMTPLQPVYVYLVLTRVLADGSIPYFQATREQDIGMPLEQYHREAGTDVWDKSEEGFSNITAMLQENEGPFFMGKTVCYADFVYVGVLLFFQQLGEDVFARVLKASGDDGQTIKVLLETVKLWSKRDSY